MQLFSDVLCSGLKIAHASHRLVACNRCRSHLTLDPIWQINSAYHSHNCVETTCATLTLAFFIMTVVIQHLIEALFAHEVIASSNACSRRVRTETATAMNIDIHAVVADFVSLRATDLLMALLAEHRLIILVLSVLNTFSSHSPRNLVAVLDLIEGKLAKRTLVFVLGAPRVDALEAKFVRT